MEGTNEVLLTAEEIYFLAQADKGRFLDYDYISAVKDAIDNDSDFQAKCKRSLTEKNYLEEDFDGSISISLQIKKLAEPIYNGDYESVFSFFDGTNASFIIRVHRLGDLYTLVSEKKQCFELKAIGTEFLDKMMLQVLSGYLNNANTRPKVEKESLKAVIFIKGIRPGEEAISNVFYGSDGGIYEETEDGFFEAVNKENFLQNALSVLKGV